MSTPRRGRKRDGLPLSALGDLVTSRRVTLRLTQRDLADLAGVGLSTVHAVEHGSDRITLAVLLRILDVLGLSVSVKATGIEGSPAQVMLHGSALA